MAILDFWTPSKVNSDALQGILGFKDVGKLQECMQCGTCSASCLTRTDPEFDDIERPVKLDQLSEALGATPVPFPFRMKCCGGPIFLPERDTALSMTKSILQNAKDMEADVVQVVCPLCSMMLDIYQDQVEGGSLDIPVLYFTQLMGLALGMTGENLALDKNVVPTRPLLKRVEAVA